MVVVEVVVVDQAAHQLYHRDQCALRLQHPDCGRAVEPPALGVALHECRLGVLVDLGELAAVQVLVVVLVDVVGHVEVEDLVAEVGGALQVALLPQLPLLELHVLGVGPVSALLGVLEHVLLLAEHLVQTLHRERLGHVQDFLVLDLAPVLDVHVLLPLPPLLSSLRLRVLPRLSLIPQQVLALVSLHGARGDDNLSLLGLVVVCTAVRGNLVILRERTLHLYFRLGGPLSRNLAVRLGYPLRPLLLGFGDLLLEIKVLRGAGVLMLQAFNGAMVLAQRFLRGNRWLVLGDLPALSLD
mmetsp:Transcript_3408/g.5753  ORF Transcript_3408/g.5753 Transcript_3408/m.5753 type:complete len:298 (-) Transcript_3408:358-1251(-)